MSVASEAGFKPFGRQLSTVNMVAALRGPRGSQAVRKLEMH
jgi:hypothetical protein